MTNRPVDDPQVELEGLPLSRYLCQLCVSFGTKDNPVRLNNITNTHLEMKENRYHCCRDCCAIIERLRTFLDEDVLSVNASNLIRPEMGKVARWNEIVDHFLESIRKLEASTT